MLPLSRNQTVDTISPLEPATINDMQDCIISLASQKDTYGVSAFQQLSSAGQYGAGQVSYFGNGGLELNLSAVSSFPHSLVLSPVIAEGRVLRKVKWRYNKGGAGGFQNMRFEVLKVSPSAVETVIADAYDSTANSFIDTLPLSLTYQVEPDFYVLLRFTSSGSVNHKLYSATVEHSLPD